MKPYQLQTQKKDPQIANSRSKSISEHNKKPQKISKKCLDSAFGTVSEDVSLESNKDSTEFSAISEITEDYHLGESAESVFALDQVLQLSSRDSIDPSDLTPTSIITLNNDEASDLSVGHCKSTTLSNGAGTVALEAEMVINHIKQARIQVMNSTSVDLQSRKLLNKLIDVMIEEFVHLPEEKDRFTELASMKLRVVILSFLLWILAVLIFFFCSRDRSSFSEPPPT